MNRSLMATELETADVAAAIWERVIRFEDAPSPTAARALLKLEFPESDHARMSELSAKARRGMLSADEQREADAYERLGCLLDILHSRARRVLDRRIGKNGGR